MAIRGKKSSEQKIKKILAFAVLLSGLVFPLACSDNNKAPTQPSAPSVAASTPTFTGTLTPGTPTNTPTLALGANTPTYTPTFANPVPVFKGNFDTSAAPHCMDLNAGNITVAESEVDAGGIVTEFESFAGAGTANLTLNNVGNVIGTGCPAIPPAPTPAVFIPTLIGLGQIQGYVNPGGYGGWSAVLDLTAGGGATLYTGYNGSWNDPPLGVFLDQGYMPFQATSYGGVPFNNPKGICSDSTGHLYLADTGIGYVDELSPFEGTCPDQAIPLHRWNGFPGVLVGGTGSVFKSPAVAFKSPYAVTCDTSGNVWVGDSDLSYPNSYMSEYTSGATTILQSWQGVAGCQVHGIAVDSGSGNVYVADAGNHLIEESPTGTLLTEIGDPAPFFHEPHPFQPSCIAFSGGFIYVGDIGNDYIDVFQ